MSSWHIRMFVLKTEILETNEVICPRKDKRSYVIAAHVRPQE